jgi:spore germination protein KA
LRLWRFIFVVLSSIIGLFGLTLGGIILLNHLAEIETYGVPYLSPFAGEENKMMKDAIFRLPFSLQYKRPISLRTTNKKRSGQEGG